MEGGPAGKGTGMQMGMPGDQFPCLVPAILPHGEEAAQRPSRTTQDGPAHPAASTCCVLRDAGLSPLLWMRGMEGGPAGKEVGALTRRPPPPSRCPYRRSPGTWRRPPAGRCRRSGGRGSGLFPACRVGPRRPGGRGRSPGRRAWACRRRGAVGVVAGHGSSPVVEKRPPALRGCAGRLSACARCRNPPLRAGPISSARPGTAPARPPPSRRSGGRVRSCPRWRGAGA